MQQLENGATRPWKKISCRRNVFLAIIVVHRIVTVFSCVVRYALGIQQATRHAIKETRTEEGEGRSHMYSGRPKFVPRHDLEGRTNGKRETTEANLSLHSVKYEIN